MIQRGETLWDLARNHHTTVDEIVKLNKLKSPDKISEGESLWVANKAVKEKTEKVEDMIVLDPSVVLKPAKEAVDNIVNSWWWMNVLRRSIIQVGAISPRSSNNQLIESKIPTYEIFVNPKPADPPIINTSPDDIDALQKLTVLKMATTGAESQLLSRSLGCLVSKEDVDLLTRVIHGEARGENFEGQVAVGAVVLNRLKDPRFPKTIKAVVYQSGAFTAVNDKQIHLDPNDLSYKAAEAALAGLDPSNGALFYFNPRLATDRWIKNRPVIKRIGNHTFSI